MAILLSVNVGLPKDVGWNGRTVHTGIWKGSVEGPRMVRRLNIDGDGQGDLAGHGGEQRAVLVYQVESYRFWQDYLGRNDFDYGEFGENFTVGGLADDEVFVGDRYRIGEAEFEVTQPRVTCFRVAIRLGEPELPSLLVAHHRPGFYLRVIREGHVEAGDEIVRTRIGRHQLTVADIDALLYLPDRNIDRLRAAIDIPALSPGWQQSFQELLDTAERGGASQPVTGGAELGWPGFRKLRVEKLVRETAAITSVYLVADDGTSLPVPHPGQFLTLRVAGAGDPGPIRSYSLSSDPDATMYRISVKCEAGGLVSRYIHSDLRPGAVLDVAAPRGAFVLTDEANPVLLLSAGVGVTPTMAMLYSLAASHSRREVWWVHVTRNRAQHAFAEDADRLLASLPNAHQHIFYTGTDIEADTSNRVTYGRLTATALGELGLPMDVIAYVCGPAAFMADMGNALAQMGVVPQRVHTELFGALPSVNPGITATARPRPHEPAGPAGTGPQITFVRSGLTVRWDERQRSLLDLADECDVPTRFSCRTGVCHTCETAVVSGQARYLPDPLEIPPEGTMLICCAQPVTDLVLDL
jgi:ferredoxin-NADP reductase/MOSC domain-containing protein YiiM